MSDIPYKVSRHTKKQKNMTPNKEKSQQKENKI